MSNFNYCPLVSIFPSAKSFKPYENLQKRKLLFLLNYGISTCGNLSDKADRSSINVNRPKILCAENYKQLN